MLSLEKDTQKLHFKNGALQKPPLGPNSKKPKEKKYTRHQAIRVVIRVRPVLSFELGKDVVVSVGNKVTS